MKMIRSVLTGGCLIAMACGLASAGTINVTCTTATASTELNATNSQISCQDFNTAVGTLVSIGITLTGTVVSPSTVTITNNDNVAHTGSATTDSTFFLSSSTPLTGFVIPLVAGPNLFGLHNYLFDTLAFSGVQNLGADPNAGNTPPNNVCTTGSCLTTVGVTGSGTTSGTDTNSATYSLYEGLTTFKISATTLTNLGCSIAGGNSACGQSTTDAFTATVVYTYSTVPEPATMFLMGTALVGCGLIRRRMKR